MTRAGSTGLMIGVAATLSVAFIVWFAGFEVMWACAAALAIGPAGGLIVSLAFDDMPPWGRPARETPRGSRLTVANIEQSLAACDRLARPSAFQWMGAMLSRERDDRMSRLALVRQMRALMVAELYARGLDASEPYEDAVAMFGADARAMLEPHPNSPVSSATIARCLDAIERLASTTPISK